MRISELTSAADLSHQDPHSLDGRFCETKEGKKLCVRSRVRVGPMWLKRKTVNGNNIGIYSSVSPP